MFGINFPEQLVVYGAFVDWDRLRVARHMGRRMDSFCGYIRGARWRVVVIGGMAYFALHITVGSPLSTYSKYSYVERLAYWLPPAGVACWYLRGQLRVLLVSHRT